MPRTPHKLGTLEGVFVPTTMTILGVILFVRTGWVVGQVGLLGAFAIIAAAFAVSTATALSLSSIVTNVRVEAGGAFALLTRTLGIEPGGSIGVPLYLAQALAIPLYVFGFREGWRQIFPEHPAAAVDAVLFAGVFVVAAVSARFAFRLQFAVLAVLLAAVVSLVGGLATHELHAPTWWVTDGETPYAAFGIFFPAVTGIMAGVNMSGELESPRRSIVRGTLWAIGVTFVTYLVVATCAAWLAEPGALRQPDLALASFAAWPPLVLAGLLSATFSSALSTAVGAPRILQALGAAGLFPGGRWLAKPGWRGEPHRALLATALVAGAGVALRDLNAIAPLITLFFLLTYAAINGTLLVQQGLALPRFRPSFRVPLVVPLVGTVGCIVGMVAVSPSFTVVALLSIAGLYGLLVRRQPEGPFGQVRAGAVFSLLSWAIGRLGEVPGDRAWQAHQLVPVGDVGDLEGLAPLLSTLARRGGSVCVLEQGDVDGLEEAVGALREGGATVRTGTMPADAPVDAMSTAMDVLGAALLSPNVLVLPLAGDGAPWTQDGALPRLVREARERGLGLWLASLPDSVPSDGVPWPRVSVWVTAASIDQRDAADGLSLVLLAAWRVHHTHGCPVQITVLLPSEADGQGEEEARRNLARVVASARIPGLASRVCVASVVETLEQADEALHLLLLHTPERGMKQLATCREVARGQLVLACLSGEAEADEA